MSILCIQVNRYMLFLLIVKVGYTENAEITSLCSISYVIKTLMLAHKGACPVTSYQEKCCNRTQ